MAIAPTRNARHFHEPHPARDVVVLVEGLGRMSLTTITHAVAAVLAGLLVWFFQDARMDAAVADVRIELSSAQVKAAGEKLQAVKQARADERAINQTYQEALNAARVRETALLRDRAAARAESDGLREQLSDAARRIAAAPPAAVAEYATTVGELLAQCSRSYQELAGEADGHVSTIRLMLDAWPSSGER